MIGDDDSDDGILPSAGPTDRRNDQQIYKVTHRDMCGDLKGFIMIKHNFHSGVLSDGKKVIFGGWL